MTESFETASELARLHRVVIIGSGFGGLFAAKKLKKAPVEVTVIDKSTHHLFQPLLYQVATGILSQGLIAPPTREVLSRQKNTQVLLGHVTDIDVERKVVIHNVGPYQSETPYDSLIVSAGAGQSYFGNDDFEEFAPGLKTIDDALELRGRIYGAFEIAERLTDPEEIAEWMTFVVVGAGATGVELAGQIRELTTRAIRHDFRNIDPASARVILVDGGQQVLASFGETLGEKSEKALRKLGIEIQLGQMVTALDQDSVELTNHDGNKQVIKSRCKVWAAGVAASPLAALLAEKTGAEVDKSGRIVTEPDLTLPGHEEIFVIGDMANRDELPGVAQVAMQGGKFAATQISRRLAGDSDVPAFKYFDKGTMATISRFRAIAKVGKVELTGFIAWLMWIFIHILYLVGFQKQITTLGHWFVAFIGKQRAERTITAYQSMAAPGLLELRQEVDDSLLIEPDAHESAAPESPEAGDPPPS